MKPSRGTMGVKYLINFELEMGIEHPRVGRRNNQSFV